MKFSRYDKGKWKIRKIQYALNPNALRISVYTRPSIYAEYPFRVLHEWK